MATDEPETGAVAVELLDGDYEFLTSTMNLMELRSVLIKKQRLELPRAEAIQDEITADVRVVIPDASDMVDSRYQNRDWDDGSFLSDFLTLVYSFCFVSKQD